VGDRENQRKVFDFFVTHLKSLEAFQKKEVEDETDWRGSTFDTYLSKQLKRFV